jgi:hypothetical protein
MRASAVLLYAVAVAISPEVHAQGPRPAEPPRVGREGALVDLTGIWESVITQDWHVRMVTPPKGDYSNIPLNPEGRRIADRWDWRTPVPQDELCKPYGAPGVLRLPGRLRISWEDDTTMKIETDAGTQTRLFEFAPSAAPQDSTWQGHSAAEWRFQSLRRGFAPVFGAPRRPGEGGTLRVVTTQLRPGYLRRNGVPYGQLTKLTEYFGLIRTPTGDEWLTVTSVVEDPEHLRAPYVSSMQFKRVSANSPWTPTPCEFVPPLLDEPPPGTVGQL